MYVPDKVLSFPLARDVYFSAVLVVGVGALLDEPRPLQSCLHLLRIRDDEKVKLHVDRNRGSHLE